MVDVFSKYAWVEPVKSKTGKDVTAASEKILKRSNGEPLVDYRRTMGKNFQALIGTKRHSSFFDEWRYQRQRDGTVQSHVGKTHVSLLLLQEHVEFFYPS